MHSSTQRAVLNVAALTTLGLAAASAQALSTDPLDFVPAPEGANLSVLYYQHNSSSAQYANGHKVGSADIKADIGIARFVHYTKVWGMTIAPQVLLPAASVSVDAGATHLSADGIGDPILSAPLWLVENTETRTYFALDPYLFVPVGNYNRKDAVNIGENRWKLVLQPGYSQGLGPNWTFDFVADVQISGDNNDAYGGGTLKQKLLYSVQPQITWHAGDGYNLSLGAYHYSGGETKLRGVWQDDKVRTTSLIGTVAYWIGKKDNLQFQYRADTQVENGAKYNGFQFRFLHVF